MSKHRPVFDALVVGCASELFETFGMDIQPCNGTPALDRVAVIGFSADGIRGSLGLGVNTALIERAAGSIATSPAAFDDWLGEASNQLLGRVKNKLIPHGVTIALALPMVLRGLRIHLSSDASEVWTYPFVYGDGALCVWLDVSVQPDVAISPEPDPSLAPTAEGELLFF